jgi:hypothetical protein
MVTTIVRSQLRDCLCKHFNEEELRQLCFDLGVDDEDVPGSTKSGKARELIAYLERRDRIDELLTLCRKQRPSVSWSEASETTGPTRDSAPEILLKQKPAKGTPERDTATSISPVADQAVQPPIPTTSSDVCTDKADSNYDRSPFPLDSQVYVKRKADDQAWAKIQRMDYVLLVEPPQQGKTSLIHRLGARCARNYAFTYLYMVNLDKSTEEGWYSSLGQGILQQLVPVIATQTSTIPVSSVTWLSFLRELAEVAYKRGKRLVIALDEVGAVPEGWATDFFATIRSVYVCRGSMERFRYLTFVISGARDPRDMIRDPRISDFNFDRTLIDDLAIDQVQELLESLGIRDRIEEVADRLYYWTNGQPYLCQKLCEYLILTGGDPDAKSVDAAVDDFFLEDGSHLQSIIDDLRAAPSLLDSLCRILAQPTRFTPALNREHFKLAHVIGILSPKTRFCQVRNRIYRRALIEGGLVDILPE